MIHLADSAPMNLYAWHRSRVSFHRRPGWGAIFLVRITPRAAFSAFDVSGRYLIRFAR
jgi:hypothetical protein